MILRTALVILLMTLPLGEARAQSVVDRIVVQLQEQGYREIEISRTLLGRTRIEARNRGDRREIVVNPRSGLILRDYLYLKSGRSGRRPDIFDDDFDEDDDNSGSGSRNSGSGSSNSGSGSSNSGSGSSNSGSGSSNSGSGSSNSGSGSGSSGSGSGSSGSGSGKSNDD